MSVGSQNPEGSPDQNPRSSGEPKSRGVAGLLGFTDFCSLLQFLLAQKSSLCEQEGLQSWRRSYLAPGFVHVRETPQRSLPMSVSHSSLVRPAIIADVSEPTATPRPAHGLNASVAPPRSARESAFPFSSTTRRAACTNLHAPIHTHTHTHSYSGFFFTPSTHTSISHTTDDTLGETRGNSGLVSRKMMLWWSKVIYNSIVSSHLNV